MYSYIEHYKDENCNISYSLIINSSTFYDIFCADCKYFSIMGGNNGFEILIRTKLIKANEIMYQTVNKIISKDTEFVTNYKIGDISEILINEVTTGKRK